MNNDIIKVSKPFTLLTPNNMLITTEVVVVVAIVSDRDNVTLVLVVKLHQFKFTLWSLKLTLSSKVKMN